MNVGYRIPTMGISVKSTGVAVPSSRPSSVNDVRLPGYKGALVGSEIDHKRGDLIGCCDPAHGLAGDELAQGLFVAADPLAQRTDALVPTGTLHSTGTDAVAADSLGDEFNRNGFGQSDHRGFGGTVYEAIPCPDH